MNQAQSKTAILMGTSNNQGNTKGLVKEVSKLCNAVIFNLNDYKILPFDYEFKNSGDDFLKLVQELLKFDNIMFATPVYWYTMSAQMKVFFDRLSDLLHTHKDLGRQLRCKSSTVLSTGASQQPEDSFEAVFINSFNYLGMNYKGMLYCFCEKSFVFEEHEKNINSKLKMF